MAHSIAESHALEHDLRRGFGFRCRDASNGKRHRDILESAELRKQMMELIDEAERTIADAGKGGAVSIPTDGISEPQFHLSRDMSAQTAEAVAPASAPDEAMQQEEERRRVLSVLESLPEEYRVPLSLRYLAGADYETIGKQLALSNGSLRGLLQRGMKMLRERVMHEK